MTRVVTEISPKNFPNLALKGVATFGAVVAGILWIIPSCILSQDSSAGRSCCDRSLSFNLLCLAIN